MNEELARLLNKIKRGMGKVFYTARAVHSRDSSCLPLRQVEWQVLTCIQGKSSPIRQERPHFPTLELPSIISDLCHQPYHADKKSLCTFVSVHPWLLPSLDPSQEIQLHQVPSHRPQPRLLTSAQSGPQHRGFSLSATTGCTQTSCQAQGVTGMTGKGPALRSSRRGKLSSG